MQHRGAPVLHARLFQACACNISCENTMIGAFEEACQQLAVHLRRRNVRRRNLFTTVAFETPVLTPVEMCTRRQFAHHNQPFTKAAISPDFHCEAKTHKTFSTRQPLQLVCKFQIANVYQGFNLDIINLDIAK